MSNGFGFSFPNDGNDRDDRDNNGDGADNRGGQNPFGAFGFGGLGGGGAGGLGDMLNQFGQMLSGMGSSMSSSEGAGPVNFEVAERIARQQIGRTAAVRDSDQKAVQESVRLADLWLDGATTLPVSDGRVEAWNPEDWVTGTMPMWKRLVAPVAEQMSQAQLDAMPEEIRQTVGPMLQMMNQFSGMNYGMQLGHALGELAKQSLTGSDFGLPVAPEGCTAVLPLNATGAARELDLPGQEVLVYIAAREAARQRLFRHVPWLVERLVSSVEEYAAGLQIDTSHIEESLRDLNLESGDPMAMQEAMQNMQNLDLSPRISSRNAGAVSRLETLLALVEGWTEQIVTEALGERIPSTAALTEAWRRRRATGGSAEQAFAKVVGIEFNAPKVGEAAELWRRATVAVGMERRDQVWDHPDFLPAAEHLDNPADFIDSLLDDAPDEKFNEEMAKLEEMMRRASQEREEDADDGEDAPGDSER